MSDTPDGSHTSSGPSPVAEDAVVHNSAAGDSAPARSVLLDDVMIVMDVVDTLRHDKRIVEHELNDEQRRKTLIDELREIYRGQGIEVTDEMLEAGVKALEEERFVYKPPDGGFGTWLAKLYVSRDKWATYVVAALAALGVIFAANYLVYERPKQLALENARIEISQTLPNRIRKATADIASETNDPSIIESAQRLETSGLNATSSGDATAAREVAQKLDSMLDTLRTAFEIRVVNREGELSGLFRVPERNPDAENYYLIVEAVDDTGLLVERFVLNEETGKREKVHKWAVRVPKSVFDDVRADKNDDGILQNSVVGSKVSGWMEPTWTIPEPSGEITRW